MSLTPLQVHVLNTSPIRELSGPHFTGRMRGRAGPDRGRLSWWTGAPAILFFIAVGAVLVESYVPCLSGLDTQAPNLDRLLQRD